MLEQMGKSASYTCVLCKYSANGKMALMSHVRSMKHLQMEQIHQIQKRAEGNIEQTEIGDIFQVVESTNTGENEGKIIFTFINHLYVNIFQKNLFLHQLTHNITTNCSLNDEFST